MIILSLTATAVAVGFGAIVAQGVSMIPLSIPVCAEEDGRYVPFAARGGASTAMPGNGRRIAVLVSAPGCAA